MDRQTGATSADGPRATVHDLRDRTDSVLREAGRQPVHIERAGDGPDLVMLSAEEYERLRRHLPRAMLASELSEADIERLMTQPIPPEAEQFNDELLDDEASASTG